MKRVALKALMMLLPLATFACGGPKKDAKSVDTAATDTAAAEGVADAGEAKGENGEPAKSKASTCTGAEIDLMSALIQSACEVPNPKPDEKPHELKAALDVKIAPSKDKVAPGGHVDLIVTFTNKSKEALPLDFTLDPTPRFSVEAYDLKGKRVDLPAGPQPAMPDRPPSNQGTARVTLVPNGSAHVKLGWDATKMKWAPEKLKGTPPEMGFPRSASGPLGKGKYSIRVVTPLTNVAEGAEHEMSAPRSPIEVGN